ncbi:hypothetical protein AB0M39_39480 [Streptomyces sp. NPDC051907]|uniref:hypothetical protein n=1 Tax=Streptomyces sp. NPDC051907 TaxID=3155284 RepID=UPI003420DDF8
MNPYSYTDPHDHRVQFYATARPCGPYVSCQAENLAVGGDTASVSLPAAKARDLADHLDRVSFYQFVDAAGDMLGVEPAHDWTRFTLVRDARHDDDQPSATVPVVVLTGRLPELARALRAEAERAERRQHASQERAQDCSAVDHDESGVCEHSPARQAVRPTGLPPLLALAAAQLPVPDLDSIAVVLAETLLAEDRPADEQQATAAAQYLLACHARELAEALRATAGSRGRGDYDYETGPGMHASAGQLAEYADRLDGS